MELKKSVKADLEWRKPTFFQIGLLVALLVVFLAFELVGSKDKDKRTIFTGGTEFVDDDHVINTEQPKELPPPPPQEQSTAQAIEIVDNTIQVADFDISAETSQDEYVEVQTYIAPVIDTREEKVVEAEIFRVVEEEPEFPGGEAARIQFLNDNVQYPRVAKEANLEGRVVVGFVVEPNGSISNIKILRSVAPSLDEEAIRVAKLMPKWKPGKQRNRAVRVQYQMPITFSLYN